MSKVTFMLGFIAGVTSAGGVSAKEPVAYLYNGVRLPKILPVDGHPYSVIFHSNYSTYLFVCAVPVCFRYEPFIGYLLSSVSGEKLSYVRYTLNANGDGWDGGTYTGSSTDWAFGSYEEECLWSDTDLMHYDKDTGEATLYINASDPVPVYE